MIAVAVFHRSAPVLPEVASHRSTAIASSVLGHAVLIALLVLVGRYVVEEEQQEPVRLVFVEPAPPPKLGVPDGGAGAAPQEAPPAAPEPPPAPQAMEYVAEPALFPPRPQPKVEPKPKPVAKPVPAPRSPALVAQRPGPAPAAPVTDDTATSAEPRGVADGQAAGVVGGSPAARSAGSARRSPPSSKQPCHRRSRTA